MAETVYVAKTDVVIGRKRFKKGQRIEGVSASRCEHLNGRLIEPDTAPKSATTKSSK